MGTMNATLSNPARGSAHDAFDSRESLDADAPAFTIAQTVMRFAFTVAALIGLSALFASQLHANLQ